jgi:hypothetical protein
MKMFVSTNFIMLDYIFQRLGKSKEAKQAYKKAHQLEIELQFPRR